jgi:hypothetical protein
MHVKLSEQVHSSDLSDASPKSYLWTMGTHGVEVGIARSGRYAAHAHRNMADIIFAPKGLSSGEPGSPGYVSGSLLVALPGTWFGPVVASDFFFVKFYFDQHRTGVPDKITDRQLLTEGSNEAPGGLVVAQGMATMQLPIFRPGHQHEADAVAEIHLGPDGLSCRFPGSDALTVTE